MKIFPGTLPPTTTAREKDAWSAAIQPALSITAPAGTTHVCVHLNATLLLRGIPGSGDPHISGSIRIKDDLTAATIAGTTASLYNHKDSSLTVPISLAGIFALPAGKNASFVIEIYTRDGTEAELSVLPGGDHGESYGPGAFYVLAFP